MDSREVAQMYLNYRAENKTPAPTSEGLTDEPVSQLKDVVGGEEQYGQMMQWASTNLSAKEVEMYDQVMDRGDPLAAFFAVQALTYRFNDSRGVDGEMLQGKAPTNNADVFRSQAQVVEAMNDPRYEKDPAYRQDLYNKLERSNIDF